METLYFSNMVPYYRLSKTFSHVTFLNIQCHCKKQRQKQTQRERYSPWGLKIHSHFQGMFAIYGSFFTSSVCSAERAPKIVFQVGFDFLTKLLLFGCFGFLFSLSKFSPVQRNPVYNLTRIPQILHILTNSKFQKKLVKCTKISKLETKHKNT